MHPKRHGNERGASVVEAAVVTPLLLFILLGAIDLGRAYFTYLTIIDAAREGARYGAAHYEDPTRVADTCNAALAEAQGQPLPVTPTCTLETTWAKGSPVKVTVHVDAFPTFLGAILGRPTFPVSYNVAYRIRCGFGGVC
jgi:Flp pilus assembly protein TadG